MERATHLVPFEAPIADAASRGYVVIIEPNFTGHRWRYVEWIAQACLEAGYPCLVVTENSNEDHRLAREIMAARREDLQIAFVDADNQRQSRGLKRISYARFHAYFKLAYDSVKHAERVRLVVVPYVDYFFHALPLLGTPFGRAPWIAITMRATFHHRKVGVRTPGRPLVNTLKSLLFRRAVHTKGLRTLLSIDPTLPEWIGRDKPRHGASVRYVADPFPDAKAEDPFVARERLDLDPAGRYLLVYGSISERKGICELVEALAGMKDAPTLLLAGEQDQEIRGFMRAFIPILEPAPVILDRFISNEMERDLFSACDVVWLGYKGHYGMSGVLVQAYRFDKPVVATSDGLIGWFCRDGQLGPCLDDLSADSIKRALADIAAKWQRGEKYQRPLDHLLARNTLGQFKETLRQSITAAIETRV
ncbi:glycosyltransferase [Paraburkholderia phymatum]|uniref:Glycosyl transferase group 1 n=1 Tax=Paraburkholderia phymatum (strain DSM 17167 / CIP 108236 / LMG 21445 / STM815) TaxID=391038 RepID=B2JGA5_PARP8|nr:glycosyltransferase [Paraburkholderia phymatum]ACC71633.1 glycosyl transferase group 1 [Paraburkholderia phymatum STM815]